MTNPSNGQQKSTQQKNTQQNPGEKVNSALDQVRTPLLAALGAGNLASQAVVDAVNRAKERVTEGSEAARKNFEELPRDVESLREKFDPAELRKVIDEYTDAALKLYNKLAEAGEDAWDKLVAQPQVKKAIEQLEDALHTAQDRAEELSVEARERVEEVLGMVSKRTRSTGEQAARTVEQVSERIDEAGEDLAAETRSATRKAADKTAPRGGGDTRRSTGTTKKSTDTGSKTGK
ncbi:heparin binding hemagglutinin HbhA [Amycolatopsis arida]|uniref:Heparin binding hemagglutinin HbhA n=1 Tax=Amycolatopsis arida TaxID=587909 RepID=A0A1I5YBK9_9PSEU|nr:hypothetical protein [Amycolatopsis arida]TDX90406.1 heparin binding hemagglutinin HbhA [Amycolatopsis arida]SFQ41576.1 heparin binding hemagglutinin HbhA [Amycolatopsis arida]